MTYHSGFKFFHEETGKMYDVYGLCFYGVPTVTVAYSPVKKYRLDSGYLLQMTELSDRNGDPIFDGDILKARDTTGFVRFALGNTYLQIGDIGEILNITSSDKYKIIGNIYENPELLKKTETKIQKRKQK